MYPAVAGCIRAARKGGYVFHYHAPVLVITAYTFASDLGAALGPMGGYAVINLLGVPAAYAAAGVLLAAMALVWTLQRGGSRAASS